MIGRQPDPWRFCLWGHRTGYIQVGSAEDQRFQAERERYLRIMRLARRGMDELADSYAALCQAAVPCGEAFERLGASFRALARL